MKKNLFAAFAALALGSASTHATDTGMRNGPLGGFWERGDANTAYAVWDTFPTDNFPVVPVFSSTFPAGYETTYGLISNDAPDSSFGITSPEMDQTTAFTQPGQGVNLYDVVPAGVSGGTLGDDVLLSGGNAVNFTFSGTVSFTIYGLTLQIKRPGNLAGLAADFSPTLTINGGSPIAADGTYTTSGTGNTSSVSTNWSVTTWYWGDSLSELVDTGSTSFTVTVPRPSPLSRSIDGFAIDAGPQAIPEPTAALLLLSGCGALAWLKRRRRR